jgi:hypothetical protein
VPPVPVLPLALVRLPPSSSRSPLALKTICPPAPTVALSALTRPRWLTRVP